MAVPTDGPGGASGWIGREPPPRVRRVTERVEEVVRPLVAAAGIELDRVEYRDLGPRATLQVFIDKDGGVTVDDCADVSRQLEVVLDQEDLIPKRWVLEVSSPGLTRPLRRIADFDRLAGRLAVVTLHEPVGGRQKLTARLRGTAAGNVLLEDATDGRHFAVALELVAKARLEVEPS